MILIPHAIVGAAVANMLPKHKVLGFVLAFASHYALDMIPHAEYKLDGFFDEDSRSIKSIWNNTKAQLRLLLIALDLFIGIILCVVIFIRGEQSFILTAIGIFAGILPDFLQFLYFKYKKQPFIYLQKIHDIFHSTKKPKLFWGSFSQIILTVCFVLMYVVFK